MTQTGSSGDESRLVTCLSRRRIAIRAAILIERLWPLLLPLAITACLFASLSWLGIFRLVPDWLRLGLVALLALAAVASLYPLRFFRSPTSGEIDRRIELANRLEHAPLRAQSDRPTADDPFAQALWREHQKRMAASLHRLGADLPHARMPERDPWGIRAAFALLLVVAFAFSFGPAGGLLGDALKSHGAPATPPRIDAWVTPPAYTGKAPLFLGTQATAEPTIISAPEGSIVTLRVTGSSEETLNWLEAGRDQPVAILPQDVDAKEPPRRTSKISAAQQFSTALEKDGLLVLSSGSDELQRWAFAVVPDTPPTIRFANEPGHAVNGTLELSYVIEDDYGAVSAQAEFALTSAADPDARPLYGAPEMKLTLPRRNASNKSVRTTKDLTDHPWAGSKVAITLHASDAAGQKAASETKTITLPQRPFTNPLASALAEQRRILALDANQKAYVLALIDAIMLRPEDNFSNLAHYLGIMSARSRLKHAQSDEALRDSADYFWEIALAIEGGAFSDAMQRLQQAQDNLQQALEDGASDEEIEQLMSELREAMQDFMRELAEQAARDPNMAMQQMPSDMQELRQGDLERMLDQLENLARSGAQEQAMDMLQQLRDMMNNLQAGNQPQQQGQGQQSQMQQQMDQLGDMMRRQQELMNETFRLDNQQRNQNRTGQNNNQNQQMSPQELDEAMQQLQEEQGALRRDLEGLTRSLEEGGMQPGEGFGKAGEAMDRAEGALGDGEGSRATGEQGQALEALRSGAQDMMQQMQQAMGNGTGGGQEQATGRDPLGRPLSSSGPDFGDSVKVPDEIDVERARRILDDIRRRLGNALSPQVERDYLERLLNMR